MDVWILGMDSPWHHVYDMIITSQLEFIGNGIEIETVRVKILELKYGNKEKQIWENIGIEVKIWDLVLCQKFLSIEYLL